MPSNVESDEAFAQFLNEQIEGLRPKLLDLTRRNPLLSTPVSERSQSNIRVVDEVPTILFEKLITGRMQLIPLPSLEEEPKDETTDQFQHTLSAARLTDHIYLSALDRIDEDAEDATEQAYQAERVLKDRIRERLNLPLRQTQANLSIAAHARNHHINPSYELPISVREDDDGAHVDDKIQTLLLPGPFERRLNSILTKSRTWEQETGISVVHVAFGFLEWAESESGRTSYAPLILMPCKVEKTATRHGPTYHVSGDDLVDGNFVLNKKLLVDFDLAIPTYDTGASIEEYLDEVARSVPKSRKWKIRRQVALGVFPSASMAMYYDLEPGAWNFEDNPAVSDLLGGRISNPDSSPYADDYDVDEIDIEEKVPALIMDADSSQFSTIVDVMDGSNTAVEGPPGSGKSQTIVNTIASALADSKKVLFVAEKTAALEVVRSRLEACGLGEFALPLLATRSAKKEVIEAIRIRDNLRVVEDSSAIDAKIARFRSLRSDLSEYVTTLRSPFGATGLSVYDVLSKRIALHDELQKWPPKLAQHHIPAPDTITLTTLSVLKTAASNVERAAQSCEACPDHWRGVKTHLLTPYQVEDILTAASQYADIYLETLSVRSQLEQFNITKTTLHNDLKKLAHCANSITEAVSPDALKAAKRLLDDELRRATITFLEAGTQARKTLEELKAHCVDPLNKELAPALLSLARSAATLGSSTFADSAVEISLIDQRERTSQLETLVPILEEALSVISTDADVSPSDVLNVCRILSEASPELLSLRNETLEDPAYWMIIDEASEKAKEVLEYERAVNRVFDFFTTPSLKEVGVHARALERGGRLRWFSSEYRTAKKFYLTVSKERKFERSKAAAELRGLAVYLSGVAELDDNENLKAILGAHFRGAKTNFRLVKELIQFYQEIDKTLPGAANSALRTFLKRSNADALISIPKLRGIATDVEIPDSTFSAMIARQDSARDDLEVLESCVADIKAKRGLLTNYESATVMSVRDLASQVTEFQESWGCLDQNSDVARALGTRFFRGVQTTPGFVSSSIKIATAARDCGTSLGEALISSFISGSGSALRNCLSQVLETNNRAAAAARRVGEKIGRSFCEFRELHSDNDVVSWMRGAASDREGLRAYTRLAAAKSELVELGYGFVFEILDSEKRGYVGLLRLIEALVVEGMAKSIFSHHSAQLSRLDGARLDSMRGELAELDREILQLSRKRLRSMLVRNASPPMGVGRGPKKTWTEYALVQNELGKKRAHLSPRQLTRRAGKTLLELKPCWMMSPLSVAQFLPKGAIRFDLVIIDEASQMTPENAIGALLRAKQTMIVGDTNQLPPTNFFRKMIAVSDDYDDEEEINDESILERANAAFRPARRLRWHYRSQHSSLIAFSNRHIYDNELIIFPSANENDTTLGVSLEKIEGAYASGTNPAEAEKMIEAITCFMTEYPQRSLGVVTVNIKQRDLLLVEFEREVGRNARVRRYLEQWNEQNDGLESFFIKNLENVQGDERDTIFIGTVYGSRSPGAPVMQRFGPISGVAGRRRLNVLFTRAKKQIVTFTSMTPADIRAEQTQNEGAYLLKKWLEFSATGTLESGEKTDRGPDSEFEEYVIKQIRAMGYCAEPQIGAAGYFIDIGITHPDWPYGYIMGVECDGATYHSSRSARDRDRLREEVLARLGWHLHRIWSTDWFEDPLHETGRLRVAIKKRLKELQAKDNRSTFSIEREQADIPRLQEHSEADVARANDTSEAFNGDFKELRETDTVRRLPFPDHDFDLESKEQPSDLFEERPNNDDDFIDREEARQQLVRLREDEVSSEFPEADPERNILRDSMIEHLLLHLPEDKKEFRSTIPVPLRYGTDYRQTKYLDDILDILAKVKR